ncbi:MAG: hypothetical protein QOH01_2702 [Verrucomicrobiota bacterium]
MVCVCWLLGAFPLAAEELHEDPPPPANGARVLILGDSLALCGFGKRLDERFRKSPQVKATFTYLACGTNPLSWLKERPYTHIQTHCGFVSIESVPGHVKELQDVYGQTRGHTPGSHAVPKLEDLLATLQPDVLIMQTGTNLFDLFPDHKSVSPNRHGPALRSYLVPFINKAVHTPSNLRKIYWVASPTSGRVSKEIQDFVLQQTRTDIGHVAEVIDSRTLVTYPYHHMEPDKEHFLGADMDQWADKVFDIVERDLSSQAIASLKPLAQTVIAETPPTAPTPPAEKPKEATLHVRAKLIAKTQPVPVQEFLPYQEFLVGYLYEVTHVIAGEYSEKQILVMHPAYIKLEEQRLGRWRIGRTYRLQLHELENTVWKTVKSKDDSGLINLQPYIRVQDEIRHPDHAR